MTPPDSSSFKAALADSNDAATTPIYYPVTNPLIADNRDSTAAETIKPVSVGLDSPVVYSARAFDSDENQRMIRLIGDATVRYKNFIIKAGEITVFWDKHMMIAEALQDTMNGTNATTGDSLQVGRVGRPVFSDGHEEMVGDRMEFNFKSEKGRIIRGRTKFQDGYYHGRAVKRIDEKVFFVSNGIYSTCDLEEPHYNFGGKKMKVILDERVIAKPVVFSIGKIPLAIFPFAMFSLREDGRQSGIILPQYGTSPTEGRFLQNLGFYWAASEFYDARFTLDFFERTGILFRTHWNYAMRYKFSGAIGGSFTRKNFPNGRRERRWDLNIRHSQTIDSNTHFSVNARFVSNNTFFKEFSTDRDERLNRQLQSNATFSKRWGEGKNSITINLRQAKDLDTGSESLTLPQIRFTRNRSALFPFKEDKRNPQKEQRWFNHIQYDYKGFFESTGRKASSEVSGLDLKRRATHDVTINFTNPKKLFGWLSLGQNLRYDEDWFDRTQSFTQDTTGRVTPSEEKGFAARRLFSYTASMNTNVYGTFNLNVGPVKGLRHRMSPSLSFTYRPDYTSSFWGYFIAVTDSAGNPVLDEDGEEKKRDRFGGTPAFEQNSMGFSLRNLFQMKLGSGNNEKKINLFNLDFSSGYNFAIDSLKFQDLRTTFRATPRKNVSISWNITHSFYKYDTDANRVVNTFLLSERGLFNSLRLTRFNFDLRWSLGGRKTRSTSTQLSQAGTSGLASRFSQSPPAQSQTPEAESRSFSLSDMPWSASVSFRYSLNKFNPNNTTKRAFLELSNVQMQLTKNWRIRYRMRWDIQNGDIADQSISLFRDLHCWEAQFNWNPTGISKGFYFRIGIKASHLRDIKLEQRGGTTSIFRSF